MTATGLTPGSGADPEAANPPNPTPVVRRPREQRRRRRKRILFLQIFSSVVFIALIAGLAYVGYQSSLKITGGNNMSVTDPSAPNYVAEVKPTPVDLVAITGRDGKLAAATVVTAGAQGKGGTIAAIPWKIILLEDGDAKANTLDNLLAEGGIDLLRTRLGSALTFGFTSAEVVDAATIDALAAKVGPITIELSDNLTVAGAPGEPDTVKYPAGTVTLQPNEVIDFLAFAGAGEPEPNQALRYQTVLEALFNGLKGKDLSDISADAEGDGGDFVSLIPELLAGTLVFDQVPLEEHPIPGTYFKPYVLDTKSLPSFVSRVVPFPVAAKPGQRARVRLLNGTTTSDVAQRLAPKIVGAGGQIAMIGNAESFDETKSRVEYAAPEAKPAAEAIATALGLTATRAGTDLSSVDVSVIVGADLAS